MRTLRAVVILLGVLILAGGSTSPATAGVSFDFFYSNLSPNGSWSVSASYGQVWQPAVYRAGWNPYYDGHWVDSDLGWTWVSDYPWGDIPYHYGTWVLDPALGWVWVPGYTWAPAWVVFRTGPEYIGWAPVAPGFSVGVSFGGGVTDEGFVFVRSGEFLAPRVRVVAVPVSERPAIFGRTTLVPRSLTVENNVVVNRGLSVRDVERASGRRIEPVPIERVARVAPAAHFTRDQLRIDPSHADRGLRAAEPMMSRTARIAPDRTPVTGEHGRQAVVQAAPGNAYRSAGERPSQPERHASSTNAGPVRHEPSTARNDEGRQPVRAAQQPHARPQPAAPGNAARTAGPEQNAKRHDAPAKPSPHGKPAKKDEKRGDDRKSG